MRKYVGLTDKRMANKRFRKTEEAILKVFFEGDYYMCAGEVARKIGVARSTVYNHHRAVREILPDYEKYVLRKYRMVVRRRIKDIRLKSLYTRMLFFIVREKRIFGMLVKNGRRGVFEEMVLELRTKIVSYTRLPKNSEKMFRVYTSEIMELVAEWGERGFDEAEVFGILKDMMYLTDTMRVRLKGLLED